MRVYKGIDAIWHSSILSTVFGEISFISSSVYCSPSWPHPVLLPIPGLTLSPSFWAHPSLSLGSPSLPVHMLTISLSLSLGSTSLLLPGVTPSLSSWNYPLPLPGLTLSLFLGSLSSSSWVHPLPFPLPEINLSPSP